MKVFVDESGKDSKGPAFVMAGHIIRDSELESFNEEWGAILDRSPKMEAFHMVDATHRPDELARLPDLVGVVQRHSLHSMFLVASVEEYLSVMHGRISAVADRPYSIMFYSMIAECAKWQVANNIDEPMDFIFDEQGEESGRLIASWTKYISFLPPFIQARFGNRPVFVSDLKFPALQAADIWAWSIRRKLWRLERGEEPDSFLPTVLSAAISASEVHWRKEELEALYNATKKANARGNRIFQHEAKILADNADRLISGFNVNIVRNTPPDMLIRPMSIPATGTKRYRLVHTCPDVGTPHLHKRSTDACLGRPRQE